MIAVSKASEAVSVLKVRRSQLGHGIVCMLAISNLQYAWTLFVEPIDARHHLGTAALQVTFLILIVLDGLSGILPVARKAPLPIRHPDCPLLQRLRAMDSVLVYPLRPQRAIPRAVADKEWWSSSVWPSRCVYP